MKEKYGQRIHLSIYTTHSKEASRYSIKGAVTVLANGNTVPLEIALSEKNLEDFLQSERIESGEESQTSEENNMVDRKKTIINDIRKKYVKVAKSPDGLFAYPTGKKGLEALRYDTRILKKLPLEVTSSYCGVGNVFSLGTIERGEIVLDIGCGAGVDTIIAGMMVGEQGRVIGIDLVSEILELARHNAKKTGLKNVAFLRASAEDLPLPDKSFDTIISNGVFNLVFDKKKAFSEAFRVLKPKGHLMVADQVLASPFEEIEKASQSSWSQ